MTLRARGVAKAFGRRTVLAGVDLDLSAPGIVRVEGANGAGKSTLLRLLAGVSRPTHGRVDAAADRAFVPERFRATGALRAGELLRLAGAQEHPRVLGVAELLDQPMGALSQGQAQRVALAAALAPPAAVLLLDEPFTALDSASAAELEALLARREGLVVVADHEARLVAQRRLVVAGGRVETADGAPARVRVRTGPASHAPLPSARADGDGWLAELPRDELQPALAALLAANVEIREVRPL